MILFIVDLVSNFDINKPLLEINEDNDDSINLVYKGLLYDTYIVMDILYHRLKLRTHGFLVVLIL
jgi:hypothetical protein